MSFKKTLTLTAAAAAIGFSGAALADGHGDDHAYDADQALFIVTSDSLETQGMAMILANAMHEQGTTPHFLLCDGAGDLAVESYSSDGINTPPGHPMEQITPEGLLQMMMGEGASVEVCAIYLPNSEHGEEDLREGVSVAAPGPMAEMMRDPAIPVFSF